MFQLPDAQSPVVVADWVELEIAAGEPSLSKTKVASIIESVAGHEPSEELLSDVWRHAEERQARYSREFFRCEGDLVVRALDEAAPAEYVACLLFSLYGVDDDYRTDPKIFERLSAEAIGNYLRGKVFVFGWPVLHDVQADIELRVRDVAARMRERFVEAPAERYKDRGVDVIAWSPFVEHSTGDHRSGQIVILVQCAAGKNWRGKTGQLPFNSWTQYLHWAADPATGFAVPSVVPAEMWHDICREAGLLFDRIRIVNLLCDGLKDAELKTEIDAWVAQQIDESKA